MSKEKIDDLMRELVLLCKSEGILGNNIKVNINDDREYYVSFEFRDMGIPNSKILKKTVGERTEEDHLKLVKHFGGVREYILTMGDFKDINDALNNEGEEGGQNG